MNNMKLKEQLRKISLEKNIDFNSVLRLYMYDRFIERLAISKYKDNFIIKGGFYLSTFFGIKNRTTMDIDTSVKNVNFTKENITRIVNEIIHLNILDNAQIEIISVDDIRSEDEYGGYRFNLIVRLDNIREKFQIDIATGDPITPKEIVYNYKPIVGDKKIRLWSYNLETILAEKVHTILSRAEANGRLRDFYDVHLIFRIYKDKLNKHHLKNAIKNTFKKRNFVCDFYSILKVINNSDALKQRWQSYQKKYHYAEGITFELIMKEFSYM